jgi:hypothetical protein
MFGITLKADSLPNPAELFLGFFSLYFLVARFSILMNLNIESRNNSERNTPEQLPRMDEIIYELSVYSEDSLNIDS